MKPTVKPIYWRQGLFLQPQHFQQLEMRNHSVVQRLVATREPHFWGVLNLTIHQAALTNEMLEVESGEFLFHDGTWVAMPENTRIQPRSFADKEYKEGKKLRAYLGLARMKQTESNVTELKPTQSSAEVTTRWTYDPDPEDVRDIFEQGAVAQMRLMVYNLRIFWEDEIPELSEWDLIPFAEILYDGEEIRLSESFIPPTIFLNGSDILLQILKNIREQVTTRGHQLEQYKSPINTRKAVYDHNFMLYMMVLTSLNKYIPLLHHLTETPYVHPWQVYGLLRQLIGEVSSYTDRVDVFGKLTSGESLLPAYDHENLGECYHECQVLIGELMRAILIGPDNVIKLKREDDLFRGDIPPEMLGPDNEFYLVVLTEMAKDELIDQISTMTKISSKQQTPTLVKRALPGVPVDYSVVPPPGLPKREDAYYFKLNTRSEEWMEIKQRQNISLFWDQAPDEAKAELVVLKV